MKRKVCHDSISDCFARLQFTDHISSTCLKKNIKVDPLALQLAKERTMFLLMNVKESPSRPLPPPEHFKVCIQCSEKSHFSHFQSCTFCEKPVCANCTSSCVRCQYVFCKNCYTISYDTPDCLTFCFECL
ncbi:hypothetical protein DSO57_1029489 [Entomophthora muscae]|uniref:Uncharacterized protein n=2 Tax=Entomophthora muscae TaxID=34485 RepID=A0ACC2TV35_9FUNG|nr:hypothetical protein DSO57_1007096 [Entomophthora muscae]KAJ9083929.1 hypothetical protein DSO57_1029489 [Entomophthora muscae]